MLPSGAPPLVLQGGSHRVPRHPADPCGEEMETHKVLANATVVVVLMSLLLLLL